MSDLIKKVVLTSAAYSLATNGIPVGGCRSARDQYLSVPCRTRIRVLSAGVNTGLFRAPHGTNAGKRGSAMSRSLTINEEYRCFSGQQKVRGLDFEMA